MTPNRIVNEDLDNIIQYDIDWKQFDGKTVLISGANGFLPAYIVETLLHLKYKGIISDILVLALVRNREKAEKKFAHHLDNHALQFIVKDVCEVDNIEQKIDFIIHAASQASPKYYGTDPVGTLKANTIGTYNMLELARKHHVQSMLNFSSSEVYGNITPENGIRESDYGFIDICNVRSCYCESKRMGETMCVSFALQYGVKVKTVRPFHTYGPGMLLDDGRVFADFVGNIIRNEDIIMTSDGSAERAFCYLTDATKAFFKILLEGENGQSYNMGNPSGNLTIKELAQTLVAMYPELKLTAKFKVQEGPYLQSKVSINLPNVDKLHALGWTPEVTPFEGFKRTIESYK